MAHSKWRMATYLLLAVLVILTLLPCSSPLSPWQVYTFHDDSFALLPASLPPAPLLPFPPAPSSPCPPTVPADWRITASVLADVTGDSVSEWALVVWRPWRDWPIQRWSSVPSPIVAFHDAAGQSCHLILLDPSNGREIWAGSALPAPLMALAAGDVDGDGRNEVVTLEGDYATGRACRTTRVDIWRWNGFGFTLEFRSPPGDFCQLCLTDADNNGILDLAVR